MSEPDWSQTHMVFIDGDAISFINAVAAIEWACRGYSRLITNRKFAQLLKDGCTDDGQWTVMSEVKYSELTNEI